MNIDLDFNVQFLLLHIGFIKKTTFLCLGEFKIYASMYSNASKNKQTLTQNIGLSHTTKRTKFNSS